MKKSFLHCVILIILSSVFSDYQAFSQSLDDFTYTDSFQLNKNTVQNKFQFNGYTDH